MKQICDCPECGKEAYFKVEAYYHNEYNIIIKCFHCNYRIDTIEKNLIQIKEKLNVRNQKEIIINDIYDLLKLVKISDNPLDALWIVKNKKEIKGIEEENNEGRIQVVKYLFEIIDKSGNPNKIIDKALHAKKLYNIKLSEILKNYKDIENSNLEFLVSI